LTVLFCDIVGSMTLSSQLDPEDLREVIGGYQQACAHIVQRHEGHIAQYLGDGILVYFGYPIAHEDDARRAVKAGLQIVAAVHVLAEEWRKRHGIDVRVRAGVHTGLVVVGEVGAGSRREQLAVGETPNIAARVQGVAEPDTVLVSQTTQRLTKGYFIWASAGVHALKGLESPIALHRALGETGAEGRLEAADAATLTPFVGRADESALLLTEWGRAKAGVRHTVMIRGDAGIGKSRHVRELVVRLAIDAPDVLVCRCSAYHQGSAFHPIIDLVERRLGLTAAMTHAAKLEQLQLRVKALRIADPDEATALIAALISLPVPEALALKVTPQRQRRRTIETLCEIVEALASTGPVLFIVEDLHWVDPSTRDLLDELVRRSAAARLMVVLTARSDYAPSWSEPSAVRELDLVRLDEAAARAIIGSITAGRVLPDAVVARIIDRAEGIPLYVEEITKAVLESGALVAQEGRYELAGAVPDRLIPDTVLDMLLARIDRLGPGKSVAQFASAIGREFTYELLRAITNATDDELHFALDRLVGAEVLFKSGEMPNARFTFKHALIQDAAYQSLLRTKRQDIHGKIARALVEQFPDTVATRPEIPAHHLTASGRAAEAIPYWQKAGERAAQRSANFEAASHLTTALELAKGLPDGAEKVQFELALQITLGPILMATRGYANPDVAVTYQRAREICVAIGDTPQIVPVLFGLWAYYVVRGDLNTARDLCEQILRLVHGAEDSGILLEAHVVFGVTLYFIGDLPAARQHLESATTLYDPAQHRVHALIFGQEPGMASNIYLAKTLAVMGDAAGAERHRVAAATIARETDHHHTSAFCMVYETVVKHLARDTDATIAIADRTIALSDEQGFPIWKAGAQVLKGFALTERGELTTGIALMRTGIDGWTATGSNLYTPYWLGLLSQAERAAGESAHAHDDIERALRLEKDGEEGVTLAELHRLHAQAAIAGGDTSSSPRSELETAIAVARTQGAGLWEARATATLASLST
jgi:class 3 adenylate cyclase/predicted ATPase